jgi:tRNA pseudouridine38-40 synthase
MARSDWRRPTQFLLAEGYRRIRVTVSYDGSEFNGWQRQKAARSVQGEIEHALYKMLKVPVVVYGSGRTDAGVHAVGQVAHFDIANQTVPPEIFPIALNRLLPNDIKLRDGLLVDDSFHARFTSISREYRYYSKEERDITPFDRNRVGKVRRFPPLELLNAYAACVVGTHDFSTFAASADQSHSRVRDMYSSEFMYENSQWSGDMLIYKVSGNAFLMHQVRSMVGTMIQLAEREAPVEEFQRRFESKNRLLAGKTAPPGGLYLYRIEYEA